MKFAYADPPYLGLCGLYDHDHPDGRCWDLVETHRALIDRLNMDFSDGWALSLHTPSLRTISGLCPEDVRFAAWVKPFASFKPGVNPAYAWEPVIFSGGRRGGARVRPETCRDFVSSPITLRRGFPGAEPDLFSFWLFDLLGAVEGDEFVDLFPGSGAVTEAWRQWRRQIRMSL